MIKKSRFLSILLILLLSFSLLMAGCGASATKSSTASSSSAHTNEKAELAAGNGANASTNSSNNTSGNTSKPKDNSKIIKTANVELETKNFDKTVSSILKSVDDKGGYIQSSTSSNNDEADARNANYTVRIPKDYFQDFLTNVGSLGKITSCSTTGENISSQYYDTQAHIDALKVQEQRLLELLKQSGSLKDMLDIENQLSNVRYQIESLTTTIKGWDNQVDYATITINIHEVKELSSTPASLGGKISKTFSASLKSLGVVLKVILLIITALIPYLIIIVPVAAVIYIIRKKKKNKDK